MALKEVCCCAGARYPLSAAGEGCVLVCPNRRPGPVTRREKAPAHSKVRRIGCVPVKVRRNGRVQWVDELYCLCIGLFLFNRPVKLDKTKRTGYPLFFSCGANAKLYQISTNFVSLKDKERVFLKGVCF